jgi:hypothetical protein
MQVAHIEKDEVEVEKAFCMRAARMASAKEAEKNGDTEAEQKELAKMAAQVGLA